MHCRGVHSTSLVDTWMNSHNESQTRYDTNVQNNMKELAIEVSALSDMVGGPSASWNTVLVNSVDGWGVDVMMRLQRSIFEALNG